jgi:hypothetical protein
MRDDRVGRDDSIAPDKPVGRDDPIAPDEFKKVLPTKEQLLECLNVGMFEC